MRIFHYIMMFFVCIYMGHIEAHAAESAWVSADQVQARLIGSGDEVAVQIRLAKGWHTYWRVPGDAGLPPRFDWTGSKNFVRANIEWPAPKRFEAYGLQTFGYEGEVTFPAKIVRKGLAQPSALTLKLGVMVCRDICMPQNLNLSMNLDVESSPNTTKLINFLRQKIPADGDRPGLKMDTIVAGPNGLVLSVFSQKKFKRADVFAFADNVAFTAKPEIIVDKDEPRKALIKIPSPAGIEHLSTALSGKTVSIVLVNGTEAIEKHIAF